MKRLGSHSMVVIAALCVGMGAGIYCEPYLRPHFDGAPLFAQKSSEIRETPDGVSKFTSQLLECAELPESVSDRAITAAKTGLISLIKQSQESGDIVYASVYFRDLNNGPWFGINESDKFFPASLLKLPLAMSFYDRAETDIGLLAREIEFKRDPAVAAQLQPFGGEDRMEDGKKYTVQYMLDLMLKESDNDAAGTLAQVGGMELIDNVYHNLGLELPKPGQDYRIDTHKYASFFRILYNATYVDKVASEKILKTLADAAFSEGLVAGVPKELTVAHKFGTRRVDDATVQLHDCGIVYAPQKPYVLCVMTQGADFNKLASFIKNTSQEVYNTITTDNP